MADKFDTLSSLYNELGVAALALLGPGNHQILIYAEAGEGWTGISVYHNESTRVVYLDDIDEIDDIMMDLWYAEETGKRWKEIQIDIDGTKFEARPFYADQLNKRESYDDRRERAVKERFGEKPIYYSPLSME